jgi:hypothetical protein
MAQGGFFNQMFGSTPKVPTLPALDLGTEQGKAIANNLKNLPQAEQLTAAANTFSQAQIQKMLENAIPGYKAMTGQASSVIQSEMAGQVPKDVQDLIQSNAAAKALGGGFAGGSAHGALLARDLGTTSLNLIQSGMTAAQSWIDQANRLYAPGMANVQSMFVSPTQQSEFDVNERNAQWNQQWLKNQVAAMPDPVIGGIHADIMQLASSFLGAYGGAMKGGA